MKNICIQFEQWLQTTSIDVISTKIAAIAAMCWIVWLVFSYAAKQFNRDWLRDHNEDGKR